MHEIERRHLVATPWGWFWLIALLTAMLLNHTALAHAFGLNEGPAARFGSDLVCTANDVSITNIAIRSGSLGSCIGGSDITLDLDLTVNFAQPDRYDIGIFIANDGNDPQLLPANGGAATCAVAVLPASAPFLNLDPGPDKNGITDTCGDGNSSISGGTGSGHLIMEDVVVNCRALSGSSGNLYIPFVVSWDNSKTTDKTTSGTCTSAADPVPNTKSKCNAPIVSQGTVAVVVLPTISKAKTGGNDTVVAGERTTYEVVITNTTGATLTGATFTDPAITGLTVDSIACTPADSAICPAAGSGVGQMSVSNLQNAGISLPAMPAGSSLTFELVATVDANTTADSLTNIARVSVAGQSNAASVTNPVVRKPVITVRKQSDGDTGSFTFAGTNGVGSFTLDTSAANPQSSPAYTVTAANAETTISETIPASWELISASCSDGSTTFGTLAGNTLTIAAADLGYDKNVTCTFTNERATTVTVTKQILPAGDAGTFNLLVGGTTVAAGIGDGGSGRANVSGGAAVTVSETAAGGTSLADYDSAYSCSDGTSGTGTSFSITPAAGAAVNCTFNNTRKPGNVTVVKVAQNVGSSGYAIPGEIVRYTLVVTNFDSRAVESGSLALVDPIPANTALVAVDPVVTVSNNPAVTGLTLTYGGLTDPLDQVEFSTDGSTFNYQPGNLSDGTDPNVTHIRFRPTGSMAGASGGTNPSFTVTFKVKIK